MLKDKKIVVVMPAYNAALTVEKTYREIPLGIVDEVILVDDKSSDETVREAELIGIQHVIRHEENKGYGGLICMRESDMPLTDEVSAIPISYI